MSAQINAATCWLALQLDTLQAVPTFLAAIVSHDAVNTSADVLEIYHHRIPWCSHIAVATVGERGIHGQDFVTIGNAQFNGLATTFPSYKQVVETVVAGGYSATFTIYEGSHLGTINWFAQINKLDDHRHIVRIETG